MSSYQKYLDEKEKIDSLLQKGYKIKNIHEDLSGSHLEFELDGIDESSELEIKETLLITNADARKYFSTILFQKKELKEV
ncbi:hypothetical protein [Chengkuizengella axinellae]|uniref:Uncharacterized protein n=1 Tax=Chengkuizengella axinellae TaxID=3064388 RepID=A0ABT9IY50_9BACL|nr:hypothetical protein [Chengkuizengella sp. 2205SS18-9]MDP5274242.1 hypothetical protein [Chengkuizengella sp. 2205SS18-9]